MRPYSLKRGTVAKFLGRSQLLQLATHKFTRFNYYIVLYTDYRLVPIYFSEEVGPLHQGHFARLVC